MANAANNAANRGAKGLGRKGAKGPTAKEERESRVLSQEDYNFLSVNAAEEALSHAYDKSELKASQTLHFRIRSDDLKAVLQVEMASKEPARKTRCLYKVAAVLLEKKSQRSEQNVQRLRG